MRTLPSLSLLSALAALVGACADEIPPAHSADSPVSTAAAEAPMAVVPSFSGRAASYDPAAAGPATTGQAHHHGGGDGSMEGMPMNGAMPTASASPVPAPAVQDHSKHSPGAPAGSTK